MAGSEREHEIVLFGATGFVGRLTARYLAEHAPDDAAIALAGRARSRLEQVRAELGPAAADWPLLGCDSQDRAGLDRIAASARVVATTVGPYQRYGLPLVEACAAAGTHYADLTGEVLFMRRAIDVAHEQATAGGARIVHACGFDSIPSDIGVLLVHEAAAAAGAGALAEATYVLRGSRGGASGGTIASLRGMVDAARSDADSRRLLLDPYALSPDRSAEPDLGPQRDFAVVHDSELGGWLAPFVMGSINTRVVRRSNALKGYAYGRRLRYREFMLGGEGPLGAAKAAGIAGGVSAALGAVALGPRRVLDRVLPDPGDGPSEQAQVRGYFKSELHARTEEGALVRCRIEAQGDPGYRATSVMLGESALCLARDEQRLPDAAGVLTPATAMGTVLADRLRAAGQAYEAEVAG